MKKMSKPKKNVSWVRITGFFVVGLMTGLILMLGVARLTWHTKFYPRVSVGSIEVGGLTRAQAKQRIEETTANYQARLTFNGTEWQVPKGAVSYLVEESLNQAYRHGRRLMISDYLFLLVNKKTNYPLQVAEGKTPKMEEMISMIASAVEIPPIEPEIRLVAERIEIVNGSDGTVINGEELDKAIRVTYANLSSEVITIPTQTVERQLAEQEIEELREKATKLSKASLELKQDDERITLKGSELLALLSTDRSDKVINEARVSEYLVGLSERLNKKPQDAKFEFSEGKVVEFAPSKDGVEVNVQLTAYSIQQAIEKLLNEGKTSEMVEITVKRTPPTVTMDKVNELGIRERIGRGESYYAHSIPNRIYNVGLAAERANTALIPPGSEFSFNQVVGEISGATGYRSAYVISGGKTVLGDGGGVCQVSTTLFRAALAAGLPITERWAHAYRVGYYEQNSKAGIDATVYAPSKDFRFLNDTPNHILVQTINDPKNLHLVVEIYGTSDGRVATISEPKVWGISAPLPTIYQDDPTLPAGTLKQVDWAASGARASFEYKVVRNGEVLQEQTFSSAYRPWASVYLRGTGE